jgi:HEAT repeat protein
MIVRVGAKEEACPTLRALLVENPLANWRAGLERGALVRELVVALGKLGDVEAAPLLVSILNSTSQEYRPILPDAAQAVGRLRHLPSLSSLEGLLFSPKDPISSEPIWAVGEIGTAHPEARPRAATLLERLKGLEPAAEATRLTALMKMWGQSAGPPLAEIRRAVDRALWDPGYRQDDTSRRRAWALTALEELASLAQDDDGALFLGHETMRHFVTRDDHRVRRAAEAAFAAWALPVPTTRRYYMFVLPEIEERDGIDGLIEAVRDPLGVFRHNVATRLAAIGDERAVRPLAEATARLFAEPPASTYEYDDAPPALVAFVRALARLNHPEGNDVLIEGLRSDNHQVRAIVAEHVPDDPRFVPELTAMLGDARSFLRSRAEKSLAALGAIRAPGPAIEATTNEVAIVRRFEG